jgi:DNA-binding HxlR family transcriptional regulator
MPRRSYDHYCGIARALDRLGERWALLIVRELLVGPRRYSDLLADLPGISTDVLATRLRELEGDGLVSRAHGGPRAYELTPDGAALAPVLDALADWGLERLGERSPGDALRGHWLGAPLARRLRPLSATVAGTVEVRLGEGSVHLLVAPDGVRLRDGAAPRADAVLTTSAETAAALAAGRLSLREAVGAGEAKLEGPDEWTGALLTI